MKNRLLLLLLLLLTGGARAQTLLKQESFETDGEGTRYTTNTFDYRTANIAPDGTATGYTRYWTRNCANPVLNPYNMVNASFGANAFPITIGSPTGSCFWIGESVRGINATAGNDTQPAAYMELTPTATTNYANLQVRVDLAQGTRVPPNNGVLQIENDDFIRIEYTFDTGASPNWVVIGQFVGDNATPATAGNWRQDVGRDGSSADDVALGSPILSQTLTTYTFPITPTGSTLRVRVVLDARGGNEELAFDNIRILGTLSATAAPVLSNIEGTVLPYAEGQAATQVTANLTLTDSDSPTLTGATVQFASGFVQGQDVLAFTAGNGISGTYNPVTGVLPLSGTASLANYQAALRSVTYRNSNLVTAAGGNRVVQFTATDGTNNSNAASRTIAVTAVLDGPAPLPYVEDFTTSGEGLRYSSNQFTPGPNAGFLRTNTNPYDAAGNPTTFTNVNGFYWFGENTTIASNPDPLRIGRLITQQVDATNFSSLQFQIRLGATSVNSRIQNTDYFKLYYRAGGSAGTWTLFGSFRGNSTSGSGVMKQDVDPNNPGTFPTGTTLTETLQNFTFALPSALNGQLVDFRLDLAIDDDPADFAFDLIQVTGTTSPPIVTAPANGSLINTRTPAYRGTAPAGSTVTVYVDGNGIGTTTATAAGTFSLTQPVNLTEGSHTVRATAQLSGQPLSTSSNTNTFTVDSTNPTVSISSTAGASGSTTSASPIPFTITFSEPVNNFVASDVTVSGGTLSGFSGSGTTYSFNVTPTAAGTVSVNVAANVTQDNAGNDNTAATAAYTFTYSLPNATVASITRLTLSPTATAQVRYRVAFSAAVTGISLSNFTVAQTGVTGASISSLSGSGTTYTVTVNTGTGNGTLRLDVANATGIAPTITNVPYVAGEVYTITKSFFNPVLAIQGTGGTGSDVTAFVDAVQVLSGGTSVANALQNGSFENHDPLANGDYGYQPTNAAWTFNSQAGIAENGSAFTPTTPIPNGIAVAFVQSIGGRNGQLQQNLAVPTGSYQVNFQAAQRLCCTTFDQELNVFINGVFVGSILPGSNGYMAFASATFAVTAPALTATITSTTAANGGGTGTSPIAYTVTFSQSVGTTFTAADVTVGNGTLSGFTPVSGTTYTFNVTPASSGAVTVNVLANVAQDANNTGNTAASPYSITYAQPVTAAPVVTAPANGGIVGTTTPTYQGTAPAGSTVTVYVDGSSIGTITATGGSFSLVQPTALAQGSHTVYAKAQTSGSAVSANSNTNTFTVDTVRPNVAISSTAGTSGSSTSTSPILFTVTFSENVTGFVASDVTVTNGTITGGIVNGTSPGTDFTFTVTPTTAGTATTVNVPANVAQDAATNSNTAAPSAYALTFTAPTIVVAPATLPNGTTGVAYSQTITASGGTAPYTYAITAGALPAGLSLTGSAISGTPTASGTFNFTITATDASAAPGPYGGSRVYSLTIAAPTIRIAPATLPGGTQAVAYSATLTASGGISPYSYAITAGALPSGLSLTGTTISGTPTVNGTFNFTITATDNSTGQNAPYSGSQSYTLIIAAPALTTWTGTVSNDWYTAGNWTAGVPTTNLDAQIGLVVSGNYPLIVTGTGLVRNLTLGVGATYTQIGGTLVLSASLTNNGTFTATGGTVSLNGTSLQDIGGTSSTRFWNLTVGAAAATLSGAVEIQRLLTLNGNLNTGGNSFTLLSNATATAMVVNSSGVVNGTTTVQRYIDSSQNPGLGYRHYSSPVTSTTVADLTTTTFTPVANPAYNTVGNTVTPFPTVYGYDESRLNGTNATTQNFDFGYFSPGSLTDPLVRGRGYTVNSDAASKVDLVGTLNTGTIPVGTLSRGTEANAGWHLLGNPYPSPLNWNAARANLPTGVIDAVYVFKSSSQYAGTYQFYQNGFGTLPGGLIGSMQGFFVRVSQPVASFSFLNTWRSTTYQNPTFNRTTADTRPSVQLELVDAQGTRDAAFVYFEQGATTGMDDHYDAAKLPNTTGLNLASIAIGNNLAVNGLPLMGNAPVTVPLFIGLPATGRYTLHAEQLQNFAPGAQPWLRDLQLNTLTDLSQTPDYAFTMNAANTTPRFELVFGPAQVLSTSAALNAQVAVFPNPARSTVSVELPGSLIRQPVTAALVDALGRVVMQQVLPAGLSTHKLPLTNVATGVYTLHLSTSSGLIVKKLVVE